MSILIKHGGQALSTRAGRAWHLGLMICLPHESRPRIGCPGKSACKAPGDWLRHFLSDYLCAARGAGAIPGSEQAGALGPAPLATARAALPRARPRSARLGTAPAARLPSQPAPACRLLKAAGCCEPEGATVRPGRRSCSFVCTESEIRFAGALLGRASEATGGEQNLPKVHVNRSD